ncbi:Two-component sensor histidine kinase, contains HisKA and HATPase domains [Enhydrobacter aerosaccus]|uniref:histidine kinase n=1 Tax=Enhydrobacter aerosaccus TaxID=225324 RepID=A0A1T4T9I3_9HYPH|nr:sensor histidine kinase [Enhydrobacter aerosaccus]SKA37043.1 Two-component sensor histidine kinase, contains HisKA and HATPase domains [Enhydrobacter aerosaccus]
MAEWSLRTKLVAAVGAALLPVVALAGWSTYDDIAGARAAREEAISASLEQAVAQHRELIEGSRRLVAAACTSDIVRRTIASTATTADVNACEGYLSDILQQFPGDYTAMMVTDETGTARCSTSPPEVGMSFADREIFRLVREKPGVSIGTFAAGRTVPHTVIPMGAPLTVDGQFKGMCSLDVSLELFSELATANPGGMPIPVVLVDRTGAPVGGNAHMIFSLPVAARLAAAIAAGQIRFRDYGKDGSSYQFHLVPLAGQTLFAVAAMPMSDDLALALAELARFGLIVVAAIIVLVLTWFGADRWCVRPLRYIGDFAGRVARGEDVRFAPLLPWTKELMAVGDGVKKMAEAIANREGDLKAGLEQRDHMLREIHHRVKNNLQMISSLLNLQAGEIRSPRIRRFFGDAQNRVLTLSILHRHLYERSSWSLVDFQQFISDLVRQISVPRPGLERPSVRYHIRAPIMAVGPDIAIPVGLIVTEAVGSALSHDFSSVASPEIRIEAVEKGDEVELMIEDNGLDSAYSSISPGSRGSFGLTLIRGLAMQLGGEARISAGDAGGTRVVVSFPKPADDNPDG